MTDRVMAADKEDFILVKALGRPSELLRDIECAVSIQRWTDNIPITPYPYLTEQHKAVCSNKDTAIFYAKAVANLLKMDIKYEPLIEDTLSNDERRK